MDPKDTDKKNLADTRELLRLWVERSQQVAAMAPTVRRLYDYMDWQVRALEQRPPQAGSISTRNVDAYAQVAYDTLSTSLPKLPDLKGVRITDVFSATATTSSAVLTYVQTVGKLHTPETDKYAKDFIAEFQKLRESLERPAQVRQLLDKHLPGVVARFESARSANERCRAGTGEREAAALAMRTFVDGMKGELLERARQHAKENMTPELAFERLFSSATTKREIQQQFDQRAPLIAALSEVAKQRDQAEAYEIDALWGRVLDFALVILSGFE